jgi:Tfp pilus assembly protein PilO
MKLFTPIFVIAICIGAYFVYIGPTYSAVQDLMTQKNSYDQVLQQAKNVASKRDQALAGYNAISPDNLNRLAQIVPVNFSFVNFADYLNNISSKYNMSIAGLQNIEQDANSQQVVTVTTNSYKTQSVKFTVNGQYPAFKSFLKNLETGLYLIDVTDLSIKKISSDKTGSSYEFDVSLKTYSLN